MHRAERSVLSAHSSSTNGTTLSSSDQRIPSISSRELGRISLTPRRGGSRGAVALDQPSGLLDVHRQHLRQHLLAALHEAEADRGQPDPRVGAGKEVPKAAPRAAERLEATPDDPEREAPAR